MGVLCNTLILFSCFCNIVASWVDYNNKYACTFHVISCYVTEICAIISAENYLHHAIQWKGDLENVKKAPDTSHNIQISCMVNVVAWFIPLSKFIGLASTNENVFKALPTACFVSTRTCCFKSWYASYILVMIIMIKLERYFLFMFDSLLEGMYKATSAHVLEPYGMLRWWYIIM